jgi:ABC-type phosphate transport system substrate-binding protein
MEAGPLDANGQDVTAADNAKLHVVPVAIGAITVIVHLPNACTGLGADLYNERPKVTLQKLEAAFYGTNSPTWGDLMPGLTPAAGCADAKIVRAVRRDSSGSTFAFKQLLARINPADASTWKALSNQSWPNHAANPEVTPGTDGGGALATLVATNAGYLGYVDLATARKTNAAPFVYDSTLAPIDKMFWLPLQIALNSPTYSDPQQDPTGYKASNAGTTVKGANCNVAPNNIPTTPAADATYGEWTNTDSTLTGAGYAACTMTYEMVWDDNAVVYCTSAEEEAKARTVKDYLTKGVLSAKGQDSLVTSDYDRLPANVLAISKKGVEAIDWNKGGQGRPCSTEQPAVTPTPTPTPGPGPTVTPPPAAPSNAITVASSRVSGTSIRLSLQLPGAGKITIASSTKPKKGKTIKLATKTITATKSGAQTFTLSLSAKAKSALKKDKKLKVTLKITYTPNGGVAKTITKSVTVKQPKKSK